MELITSAVLLFIGAFVVWLLNFRKDKSSTDLNVVTAMEKVAESWKALAHDAQEKIQELEDQLQQLRLENEGLKHQVDRLSTQVERLLGRPPT